MSKSSSFYHSTTLEVMSRLFLGFVFLIICYSCSYFASSLALRGRALQRLVASSCLATGLSLSFMTIPAGADEAVSKSFAEFITLLEKGDVERVVFKGIRPEYCLAFFKDGTVASVRDGFPSYDDPKSASGPSQAIAKCQHTPGVICEQDISETLALSKKLKGNVPTKSREMMSHSSYPQALKDGTYVPPRPASL